MQFQGHTLNNIPKYNRNFIYMNSNIKAHALYNWIANSMLKINVFFPFCDFKVLAKKFEILTKLIQLAVNIKVPIIFYY